MAKNEPSVDQAEAATAVTAPATTGDFPLSLHEFCTRLSATDRRVELIGGFEHSERVAGRIKDTESSYAARFDAFIITPA